MLIKILLLYLRHYSQKFMWSSLPHYVRNLIPVSTTTRNTLPITYIYIYIYIYTRTHAHIYYSVCVCVCVYVCARARVRVCACVCKHIETVEGKIQAKDLYLCLINSTVFGFF